MNPPDQDRRKHLGRAKAGVAMPVPAALADMPADYGQWLSELKQRVSQERVRAVLSANATMILLYWDIGQAILAKQQMQGWGARVIDRLSHDLKTAFPAMSGFSPRNLKYMRLFASAWPDRIVVQRTVAQLPWRSNLTLLEKIDAPEQRLWYADKAIQQGLSRDMLVVQIESRWYERQGSATHNFSVALPPTDSDMAAQVFKDPYLFDFLGTAPLRREAELEQKLVDHIQQFLLELGQGFAFVGKQVHLELGDRDFYLDLLFYHLQLRCYVVVELKAGQFEPAHVSQLNIYLKAVDDLLRHPDDKPTIGLLLVKDKDKMLVEYTLSGHTKPMGVANWAQQIQRTLPEEFKSSLPSVEEIESELQSDFGAGVDHAG